MGVPLEYARNYFISRGYSAGGAAGIVGNLQQESGGSGKLNTSARNPGDGRDGSDSIGIAQWNSGRARELKSFAARQGKSWQDGDVQLAFVEHELKRDHPSIDKQLRQDISPAQGAKAFIGFERPKGWNTGGGEIGNRISYANAIAGKPAKVVDVDGDGTISESERTAAGYTVGGGGTSGTGGTEIDVTAVPSGGGSTGTGSGDVAQAIDRQTDAATVAEDAARVATFDSLKDYAGRFIVVALGLVIVAGGVYMLSKGATPAGIVRKVAAKVA